MSSLRGLVGWLVLAAVLAGCPRAAESGDGGDAGEAGSATDAGIDRAVPPDAPPGIDAPPSGSDARDAYINIFEIFPLPEGGAAGECAMCVESRCGMQINGCINNDACRAGFTCALSRCLGGGRGDGGGGGGGGGGLDLACINSCFMGNLGAAAMAIGAVTCLAGTCGMTCAGAFGGDGGGFLRDGSTSSEAGAAMDAMASEAGGGG